MSGYVHAAQRGVDEAYRRTQGPVAFLDESYQAPADDAHRDSFYVLTAVLVTVKDMGTLRSGLGEIAGSDYWHTRDALKTDEGRAQTREIPEYRVWLTAGVPVGVHPAECGLRLPVKTPALVKQPSSACSPCLKPVPTPSRSGFQAAPRARQRACPCA